jgi:phosphate starvation-inducible PhoH-like protein
MLIRSLLFLTTFILGITPLCSGFIFMKKENPSQFVKLLGNKFYKPKTDNQIKYVEYLNDAKNKIVFSIGPAGTGKTALACNNAIKEYQDGKYNKIIITRPVVPVEEEIGYLPGTLNKKMDPWVRPIFDIFLEFYSQKEIDEMMYNNIIEISPLGFMRGRTFKRSFIIADEMQNSSPNQMLMLTTRIGEGSKMVITGDLKQADKIGHYSGLHDFIKKWNIYQEQEATKYNSSDINHGIKLIELGKEDIMREPIISKLLDIYAIDELKLEREKQTKDCALIPKNINKDDWNFL